MAVTHEDGRATLIEVLDRVLDKGIVIDAWVRLSLAGMDLLTLEARVVMASLETYLTHAGALSLSSLVAPPAIDTSGKTTQAIRRNWMSRYRSR
jgi:gas vesicle structural protein